ncbi:Glycosyltransferase involved in cell wall bisynthesis [Prevotella sp. khp1]|uniref:glycosyltransferase family 4 protein n=1 Tax=Prevotellaceae TaxID=171552 RepID=UPI0008810164|nr:MULTISPECIES: glycosyltransferase family 4 protein [Prevotellaceae]QVJ80688.1 glycosyltransferase family 4 protein [Xylanibacter ruminicola]SDQ15991.1 Glycosyltransferase involved in cell wall bisynthesis [Prevotella sp. khp1]
MRNEKYKIVYCTPALYSAGGTERVVSVKANYFADVLGYDVTIIVTEGKNGNSFFSLSKKVKVINLGLNFEELWNISLFKKILLYLRKQRKYRKRLSNELLRIQPDITITTLRREINFINDVNDGSKKIGEQHLSRTNYRKIDARFSKFYEIYFFRWWKDRVVDSLKKLDRMVVLTNDAVFEWPELSNIRMIPDPLSLKICCSSSLTAKRVITIGRYSYEKGYDILLKIWSVVEKNCIDWQLDVYAMGDPTPYVKLMDDLSIDKRRCYLHSSVVDVEEEYLKSSILVQPSRTEGFGLVIVEAMACGLPIISFDCENGPRSIITDGEEGFLIPTFDIEKFANRLIQLINDVDLRKAMGEKGRNKSQCYQIESVGKQWKQLFDELMQKDGI